MKITKTSPKHRIKARLSYLKQEIQNESISTSEILELQGLAEYINPNDTLLSEWALVPEFGDKE